MTSLGCCSPRPGNTCLSDVPRGATGWGAEPRGAEGAGQRVAQPGWHHGTVCLAGKPEHGSWNGHQILQGIPGVSAGLCLGSWQGVGRSCTLCFREPLPLPGVFLLGPQESAGAAGGQRDRCRGCCHSLGRSHWWWEGHRGFGSHWAGTEELDDQRGERGWLALSSASAAVSVTQQRVAVPCWDTEPSPGSQARGLAAPDCQMPVEVADCCSCARGMKETQREQAVPSRLSVPPHV